MWQIQLLDFETFWSFFFFLNIFSLRLVELMEAEPAERADCIHTFSLHSFPDSIINVSKNYLFVLLFLYICIVFYSTLYIFNGNPLQYSCLENPMD